MKSHEPILIDSMEVLMSQAQVRGAGLLLGCPGESSCLDILYKEQMSHVFYLEVPL